MIRNPLAQALVLFYASKTMIVDRIMLQRNQVEGIRALGEKAHLVFVGKYYSWLDHLVFAKRLQREGLVSSLVSLRAILGHEGNKLREGIIHTLKAGASIYLTLLDNRLWRQEYIYGQRSPFEALLEAQEELKRPICLIPLGVVYRNTPNKIQPSFWDLLFGYGENPGLLRKVVIFLRYSKNCFLSLGDPIYLKEYLETDLQGKPGAFEGLKRRLTEAIDLERSICLGPVVKDRRELKESVLMDRRVTQVISQYSKGDRQALLKARKEAEKYFEEIAADYSPFYAELFSRFLTWLWSKLFEGIHIKEEELVQVKDAARKATLIYIPSHRSHVDYLVLNYMLYKNMLHTPRIAAGVNLLFWPMGRVFRKAGAFFIRRAFRGAKLYTAVFMSYIRMLIEEGYPIEFFIEGGRTRTGKLINPKSGLLNMILQAYLGGMPRELAFVPASIVYDKVPEDEEYIKELKGQEKEKESTLQFLKAARFLKRRYGQIHIGLGTPIYMGEFIRGKDLGNIEGVAQNLADEIALQINQLTTVTPLSIISAAVLSKYKKGFDIPKLEEAVCIYMGYLKSKAMRFSGLLLNPKKAIEHTIAMLRQWNIIVDIGDKKGSLFGVPEDQRMILEYYKNSLLYHILPVSFVALSLFSREVSDYDAIISDIELLKVILQNEFVFGKEIEVDAINSSIQFLLDSGYCNLVGDYSYNLTDLGKDKLWLFAGPICGILEIYWLTSKEAIRLFEEQGRVSRIIPKNIFKLISGYTKLNLINYPESISQITVNNAAAIFNVLIRSGEVLEKYLGKGADIYTLSRRLEALTGRHL